jgi:FKBP-type peptidyl-prolyl cis-trans isomerase
MRRTFVLFAALYLFVATVSLGQTTQPAATPPATTNPSNMDTQLSDASYGIGFNMGKQLSQAPFKLDIDRIVQGLRDANAGKPSAVPEAQIHAAMDKLQSEAAAGAEAKARDQGDVNIKAGDAYRAENGKKAGVTTTASGLQIETLVAGTGETPKATDKVKVHYTGTLIDGTKFDSSIDRGEPITFPLNGVIKGWGEGLQLMKVGGKARLVIPPSLGYGTDGTGPIPPNATLVFEVQLISIEK